MRVHSCGSHTHPAPTFTPHSLISLTPCCRYQKQANFVLFLMFIYSIWNYLIVVFLTQFNFPGALFK